MKNTSFGILAKRELKGLFSIKKLRVKNIDIFGLLLNLVIVCAIGTAFVLVLTGVIGQYSVIYQRSSTLPRAEQLVLRQREFMTLSYAIIVIVGILLGLGKINGSITYDKEMENLLRLPVTNQEIFLSKLTTLYIYQVVSMSIMIIAVNVTFAVATDRIITNQSIVPDINSVWFWVCTALTCLMLPALSFLFSAVLSVPAKYIVNWIKTKYILLAILFIATLCVAFWLYSSVLTLVRSMFETGQIKYTFSDEVVKFIIGFDATCYPVAFFTDAIFGVGLWYNLPIMVVVTIACILLIYLFTRYLFNNYIMNGANIKKAFNKKIAMKKSSPFGAFVWKEFITVLRTPDYTFSYFGTAFSLPIMVYCCTGILAELITNMIALEFNFEIGLLCVTMFAVLTNTFCATNISREGELFIINKSLPTNYSMQVLAKVLFCSIINVISLLATCLLLWLNPQGFFNINAGEFIVMLCVSLLITTGEIFMATNRDLRRPKFSIANNPSVSNSASSFSIAIGFIISIALGFGAIVLNFLMARKFQNAIIAHRVVVAVVICVSAIFLLVNALCLFVGLGKRVNRTVN
ncbi:MAG: hypothetical protein PHW00_00320 [Clostridia bacterium]|nr:hypothetical protein [Clostridia bacterium]